ncbi:MAG: DEAD/DEAH box helicase [Aliarcobacter sp.]
MLYAPGMRVLIRDEEWVIKKVENNTLGKQTLHVQGISRLVKGRDAIFLADLEKSIDVIHPSETKFVIDDSPRYIKSRLYLESQWRQQIPTDSKIHIGQDAAMDLMNYQLDPAQMALKKPRQRILIADATGLGKTLEAGILMSELIARGKGKRILVVTVKSMMMQFQKEMWNRFTIPLTRLDSAKIQKIRSQLPSNYNPFSYFDKAIVSIDTLKRDIEYRTHLENAYWDIIVIDEAQNVAERGGSLAQRARLARLLSKRSDTLILLSATPHDGKPRSFASLMRMLDPTAIADMEHYTKEDIKDLCIRRFKKDVKNQASANTFKEGHFIKEHIHASPKEEIVFKLLGEMDLQMDRDAERHGGRLFRILLTKSLFSSPAACIKTVDERLKKLYKKYPMGDFEDIGVLENFKKALLDIDLNSFTRYNKLVSLLTSPEYGWDPSKTDDRVVIFTERIETMKYIAENLRHSLKILGLSNDAIKEISGGMSDREQQQIVDEFGRKESKIRVLVGSDVVSEGINLHYLSHRMVHFDIPWSLMVFQQRNGRIDRYGQEKVPDIRYLFVDTDDQKIQGDVRILEILTDKEAKARVNIGDPASLLNLFDTEAEENYVAGVMSSGTSAEDFGKTLDSIMEEFDPLELLMSSKPSDKPVIDRSSTLYSDLDYLNITFEYLSQTESGITVRPLETTTGIELTMNAELSKRLRAILPEEAVAEGDVVYLSNDKDYCMNEMARGRSKSMIESSWPDIHYLWKLHPIFDWINDKNGTLFERQQAPLIGCKSMSRGSMLFIISGSIPNRKSTPLVDQWFGIEVTSGGSRLVRSMEESLSIASFRGDIPNDGLLTEEDMAAVSSQKDRVIEKAEEEMRKSFDKYQMKTSPQIANELNKLSELRERHRQHIHQMNLLQEVMYTKKEEEVNKIFDEFTAWVKDTLTIENVPYLRIIAVFVGVN